MVIFYPFRDYGYGSTVTVAVENQDKELGRARFDVRSLPALLSGVVTDQALTPLEGVTVGLSDLNLTAVTNHEGVFSFGFGTFAQSIPAGRHRLVVNPNLELPNYGSLIRNADLQAGRRTDVGALTARLLDRREPFRRLSSGDAGVSMLNSAAQLDFSQAELRFPDGQNSGNAQAEIIFGSGLGFPRQTFILPFFSLALQPMGIEVAGTVGLNLALPPAPGGQGYEQSLPDRVLIAGVDNQALELVPVGVARVDRATSRLISEGGLSLTRLDFITVVPLGDALAQDALARYANGEITLMELTSMLGAIL
jgi:hypothetical protein